MYIETRANNQGEIVSVGFERTDIIQTTKITFFYNRFSVLTIDSLRSMGGFRNLLAHNIWSTRYNIPKNDR